MREHGGYPHLPAREIGLHCWDVDEGQDPAEEHAGAPRVHVEHHPKISEVRPVAIPWRETPSHLRCYYIAA